MFQRLNAPHRLVIYLWMTCCHIIFTDFIGILWQNFLIPWIIITVLQRISMNNYTVRHFKWLSSILKITPNLRERLHDSTKFGRFLLLTSIYQKKYSHNRGITCVHWVYSVLHEFWLNQKKHIMILLNIQQTKTFKSTVLLPTELKTSYLIWHLNRSCTNEYGTRCIVVLVDWNKKFSINNLWISLSKIPDEINTLTALLQHCDAFQFNSIQGKTFLQSPNDQP